MLVSVSGKSSLLLHLQFIYKFHPRRKGGSMSETVRMGVIGIGIMGKAHLKDIAALENTELVAICDVNQATA